MASIWKYADLPAEERLDMIRNGNKDVYDNEIARSLDKIDQYKKAGLSTDAQMEWIDTVSYNYNQYNASQMGIPSGRVNKTGYTDVYFGLDDSAENKEEEFVSVKISKKADFDREVEKATQQYMDLIENLSSDVKIAEEWLINNGIDKKSEYGEKYIKAFEDTLSVRKKKYYNEYVAKISELIKKYY